MPPESLRVPVEIIPLSDHRGGNTCPECRSELDVHQPEPGRPDRLVTACGRCGRWSFYYYDAVPDHVVVIGLPDRLPAGPR